MAEDDKSKYKDMREKVKTIIRHLENSSGHLKTAKVELKHYFKIDGSSADNNKINEIKNENDQIKNYLKNTVLPEINKKIN